MFFYKYDGNTLFSMDRYDNLKEIDELEAKEDSGILFYLTSSVRYGTRRSFCVSSPDLFFLEKEDLNLLNLPKDKGYDNIPNWILERIGERKVMSINTQYSNWRDCLKVKKPNSWKVNIVGLGDVGGTLLIGLRLLGGDAISQIGIYARAEKTIKRWELELNQIMTPFNNGHYPPVMGVEKDDLFDCDMFIFCASKSVPPVGSKTTDVRMVQFESNSKIIAEYAKMARDSNFKGVFAVVSDPVDLLSKVVYLESNKDDLGALDYKGLAPEQIRGYGLGVMNARATYYAQQNEDTKNYVSEGRAFGPHGEGLVIANSIDNYDDELSQHLTIKAKEANLEVRAAGFKPYIAPALSSGTLSILATIRGDWHYSATYIGGVFIGSKNRLISSGTELERLNLPEKLYSRLSETYERLGKIL